MYIAVGAAEFLVTDSKDTGHRTYSPTIDMMNATIAEDVDSLHFSQASVSGL